MITEYNFNGFNQNLLIYNGEEIAEMAMEDGLYSEDEGIWIHSLYEFCSSRYQDDTEIFPTEDEFNDEVAKEKYMYEYEKYCDSVGYTTVVNDEREDDDWR